MVLPQGGLTCFYETFLHKQTIVLLLNFCAKIPRYDNTRTVVCNFDERQHNVEAFLIRK